MRANWRLALKGAQIFVLAVTFAFLLVRVGEIGWAEVWRRCPTNPLFYLAFLAWYFLLPVVDTAIHGKLWNRSLWPHLHVFCIKKVYNFAVVGYSGEAYVFAWAKSRLGMANRTLFSTLKDNAILSGTASNLLTLAVGAIVFLTPASQLLSEGLHKATEGIGFALMAGAAVVAGVALFRKTLLALDLRSMGVIFAAHSGRLVLTLLLQAAVWALAAPEVEYTVWLMFLAFYLLLTRIPFLPNQDLVFMGASVAVSGALAIPDNDVATAMLLTGALTQLTHALVFAAGSITHLRTAKHFKGHEGQSNNQTLTASAG